MACEYESLLGVIEQAKINLRFKIGGSLVQIEQVSRIRERKPNAGSRCLLEEVLKNNPDSDIVTLDPAKGLLCERCGIRIRAIMERVRPEGIGQRPRRR